MVGLGLLYTASSGIWIFRGALRGSQVLPALASCFDWAVRGTYRTAWAVQPCCRCSYSYGNGPAVGPHVSGNWEFLRGLWRAVAPLMAAWCADGEMPTCANLNLYGGSGSRVRWHSDNEGLFGKKGGVQTHYINEFWRFPRFSNGNLGLVWTVMLARPGYTMVTFWSWMVVVRMSIFTVRIPCGEESG